MGSEKDPAFEGTTIDLGEDLLEATRVLETPASQQSVAEIAAASQSSDDALQRGQIFMNERLFEDAKKVFRKILRNDPSHAIARQFLDEIQKQEIQDLLGGEASRKRIGERGVIDQDAPALVIDRLEKDLRLGIEKSELKLVPDLFESQNAFERYRANVMSAVIALPARERIDIGIAHLEMSVFEVAQSIFESVVRYEEHKTVGMYLLGLALIYSGKAIEATIRIEPLVRDLTLSEGQKTDFLYLMGMAFERLADTKKAREFYRRVYALNPKYRDVLDKLK